MRTPPHRLAALALILFAVLCGASALLVVPVQAAFQFAPLLNVYATDAGAASTHAKAILACQETGGIIAAEPTTTLHTASVSVAKATGLTDFYAFLGGDTMDKQPSNVLAPCPADMSDNRYTSPAGPSVGCVWHWSQGRWILFTDDPTILNNVNESGVAFYTTNTWNYPGYAHPVNSMVNYFYNASVGGSDSERRPGSFYGRYLLLVSSSLDASGAVWSDNSAGPGYNYAGYTYNKALFRSTFDNVSVAASAQNFVAVCQTPTPVREQGELSNTSSQLQLDWWLIFFFILLAICTLVFVIVVCCQEREDMDEPPEDAPEWARKNADEREQGQSFVSQRSFRVYESDDGTPASGSRSGSMGSRSNMENSDGEEMETPALVGEANSGSMRGSRRAIKEADYEEEEEEGF